MKYSDIDNIKVRIILFDGLCNLCNRMVKFINAIDKRNKFKFASLDSETGHKLLGKFDINNDHYSSVVLILGQNWFIKSSAILKLFKELGGFWKLFYILIFLPLPVRDYFYDLIANNRYKLFGKSNKCVISDSEKNPKFLE